MNLIPIAAVAILAVAWLTAAGMGVRSVSRIWLRHWVERRLAGSTAGELFLERPHRLLLSAGSATAMVVFLLGTLVGAHAQRGGDVVAHLLVVVGAVLVFGQLVPRALARRWPNEIVPFTMPVLRFADMLLAPVRKTATWLAQVIVPAPPLAVHDGDQTLEDLLREGELEGVGEHDEIAIITGVVQFGLKRLRDVMTPREQIFALDMSLSPEALAREVAQANYSRVPLYRGTLDDVAGMIHVFDVLKEGGETMPPLRPVAFADVDAPCNTLLFEMLRQRKHMAIVRDNTGRTVGLVTMEDLLEELVGDIRDEHDEPQPTKPTTAS